MSKHYFLPGASKTKFIRLKFLLSFLSIRSEKQHIKIPFDIEDAKMLGRVLDQYKDTYYFEVMFGVVFVYVL